MSGVIYVVATPIGNLNDLTPRMKEAFEAADFIAAEDTRVTVKLLNHMGIKKPMVSYYEHNLKDKGEYIISRVMAGENCAVCSDAGTPCISDPGEILVKQAHANGIRVIPVTGPSAVITALSVSGQNTGRFCFEGFLSTAKKQRLEHLEQVKSETRTMIFYEAPHKLLNTLRDFKEYFGADRSLTIARELTKLHEQIWLTTVGQALDFYTENSPKGEFVLIVAGGVFETAEAELTLEQVAEKCIEIMESENLPLKEAAKQACAKTKFSKSEVYRAAQNLRG
ncbi:MAG: 16S rRNA (cytidine(1402)-2'-O)-methyltransferase [Oscillospiraceae bacterium]|nr:16S rRNA (cytidine(1402)-2'-O)-methyltransferase [Oscillospiraceae bacterium]MBR2503088.1 16S rRNA (cytidine(1402)-2'-O)-methyltransferase [Oscillospiraceae bacterium]